MEIIIDACSVILLGKVSVLETFVDTYEVYFTEAVINEVLQGKSKMFEDALLLERLQNDKKIKTVLVSPNIVKKLMFDFNMGVGEASVVASGIGRKNVFIVTDNRQGRKAARINHISVAGSIEIVVSLYKKKKISFEKAKTCLKKLEKEGWFDRYLIETALEDLK